MRLISDFSDYYDHEFNDSGSTLIRVTTDGPCRRKMFPLLNLAEYMTPVHGDVKDVLGRHALSVVAYLDESAHCGEGKVVWSESDALAVYRSYIDGRLLRWSWQWLSDVFCSAFVGDPDARPSCSIRHLFVGYRSFTIEYRSYKDWRSNVGDGEINLLAVDDVKRPAFLPYPLFAVDMVDGSDGRYAVDLNVAPGIRGTGVEKVLKPREVIVELEKFAS